MSDEVTPSHSDCFPSGPSFVLYLPNFDPNLPQSPNHVNQFSGVGEFLEVVAGNGLGNVLFWFLFSQSGCPTVLKTDAVNHTQLLKD